MNITVITLFPEMLRAVSDYGVTRRAMEAGILEVDSINPRDFARDVHRTVDDRPFGGGPGMVMLFEPLQQAVAAARKMHPEASVIYMSPQGRPLDQAGVSELGQRSSLIILAGRYEGIDQRLLDREVDEEWSIGDYVISGGELAAMVVIDAVCRQIPGTLGHDRSAVEDSFYEGLLDCPHYTRPEVTSTGERVPDVLLSGNHEAIRRWRLKQALGRTWQRRPDLLAEDKLNEEQQQLLEEFKQERETQDFGVKP